MTTNKPITVSITPWLSVRKGALAVEFYKSAFAANEVYHVCDPAGSIVSRLSIEGAEFWVSDESPEHGNFSPDSLGGGSVKMIIVPDPDSMFAKAVAAGAREVLDRADDELREDTACKIERKPIQQHGRVEPSPERLAEIKKSPVVDLATHQTTIKV
jgi:PhnB protein